MHEPRPTAGATPLAAHTLVARRRTGAPRRAPCAPLVATTAGIALSAAAAALAWTLWAGDAHAAEAPATAPVRAPAGPLVHRFTLAPAGRWTEVTVPLRAGAWHPAEALGELVTPERWRAVRAGAHGLAIGAHCRGSASGKTHYPCAVEVGTVRWLAATAPAAGDTAGDGGWEDWRSSTGDTLYRYDAAAAVAFSMPDGSPPLLSLPAVAVPGAFDAGDFVGLLAPPDFLARGADPGLVALKFRVRLSRSAAGGSRPPQAPVQGSVVIGTEPLAPPPEAEQHASGTRI